jgi:predicted protein tyrosine phosphatase
MIAAMEVGHPDILALGFSEAAMMLRSAECPRITALISIHGENEPALELAVSHRLDLAFDDTDSPDPEDVVSVYQSLVRRRIEAENGRRLTPPTCDHAREIIAFAKSIQQVGDTVLCQCGGGISRAPAAALICLAAWTAPGRELECLQYLRRVRPAIQPHPDLLRFADALLDRQQRLARLAYR